MPSDSSCHHWLFAVCNKRTVALNREDYTEIGERVKALMAEQQQDFGPAAIKIFVKC